MLTEKEKMAKLWKAVEGKTEDELYFVDVSFMADEDDWVDAMHGPSCIPHTDEDGELIGVAIEHPYEYEGECFTHTKVYTFEELRAC